MPVKASGPGRDPAVHRFEGGLTWLAHPDEEMARASHALAVDGGVWAVEPVDVEGLDGLLSDLGTIAGVVVLAAYHRRDAAAVARRHDVPVYLPATVSGLADGIDATVDTFEGSLPGTDLRAVPLYGGLPWSEAALFDPGRGTLVATEALVASDGLTGSGERLAVTPYARPLPPREALSGLAVERVLTGHGGPVLEDADEALAAALANARRGAPRVLAENFPYLLRAAYVALRD